MRYFLMLAVTALAASSYSNAAAVAATAPTQVVQPQTIVALGDSLTSGRGLAPEQAYPAVLQQMLHDAGFPFTVVNHGVSGDTTAGAVRRLDAALKEGAAILIVALGANDGLRGVPVAEVRRNLETIIDAAQKRDVRVLLCGMEALPLYGWEYTVQFHRLFPTLAKTFGVPLVPFLLNGVVGNQEMLQPDLVHPSAAGAAQIARTIWPFLQPLAEQLARPYSVAATTGGAGV